MLDHLQGPIWISDVETGEPLTGLDVIDKDKDVIRLNKMISDLYNSFYEFDEINNRIIFNREKEIKGKGVLCELSKELLDRLDKINDGSFIIENKLSDYIDSIGK